VNPLDDPGAAHGPHAADEPAPLLSPTNVVRIPRLFSRAECEEIIGMLPGIEGRPDRFRHYGEVRGASLVRWLDVDLAPGWLTGRIGQCLDEVATRIGFDISGKREGLKFLCYRNGNRVPWHVDCGDGHTATRKLTLSALLSAPTAFEGGVLTIAGFSRDTHRDIGDAIVFPAYMAHKVTTVKRGSRHALVAWAHGPRFS
jgi:PKHD-type hydroxylase